MATHSSVPDSLSRRIPGTGEPGGLPSLGSCRVKHDWSNLAAAAAVKAMVFPAVMYGCESWIIKKAECQRISALQIMVLKKTLESPLDYKETKPVNPKGNQPWVFIGRTEAKASILWPSDAKNWLTGKDPDAGRDWRQEEKGMTEDEMVGWHHRLNGHEFEQALGVGDG